jgi:hypothetical protein
VKFRFALNIYSYEKKTTRDSINTEEGIDAVVHPIPLIPFHVANSIAN